ncbi:hypothetical protein PHLCEN_2v3543 [Hermanssonia centrifuga]|uniref:Uncharacterized protein n=1 Tax=Hermanssonia centrifuga TaxID=98765 RepID=A0A2R6QET9_9APHY|nr:hypothetical protein PHLCEN_2v3543 [Hermanssonia centrifuga]
MSTYNLTISINSADIPLLKDGDYRLCIAKRVNDKYDVVWSGGSFFASNSFAWDAEFQVFGALKFQGGFQVQSNTNFEELKFGQTVVLDHYGVMESATGPTNGPGVFHVQNNYGAMCIGVNAKLGGAWSPIYLSQTPFVSGVVSLTPIEKVLVWFDASSSTGTMLVDAVTNSIEVDFTGKTSQSVTYASDPSTPGKGGWVVGGSALLPSTYNIETDTFSLEIPSAPMLGKLSDIINSQNRLSLTVSSSVEFDTPGQAGAFVRYALGQQPDGVRTWNFTQTGAVVDSKLQAEKDQEDKLAIKFLQDAYLGVLYSFPGPAYNKLTFQISNRHSLPISDEPNVAPVGPAVADPRSSGELRIIYSSASQAADAAKGITALAGNGLSYVAEVHSDDKQWVRARLSLTFPSGNVDQDRHAIVDPLATALFGGGYYFKQPPLFPNTPDFVMYAVKWGKD